MRKKKTKSKKSKKFKKVKKKKKNFKRKLPKKRKVKSKPFNKRKKKRRSKRKKYPSRKITKETFRKILRFSNRITPEFKFNFNIDRALQNFFQRISNTIKTLKQVIEEEREKNRREKIKVMEKEKDELAKQMKSLKEGEIKRKQEEIKLEQKIQRERKIDLKRFIREEQALVRKEQAEKQRKFYEKIRLEKKIEEFRKREELEIKNLTKFVLSQERENYSEVQERISRIKLKYQAIRDQKIRERIEQLGIEVSSSDTRSELLDKERQFNLEREKIENNLESFYRSMASCVFQLNRKWLPKKMSLLRVIDRRYETSEIFIKLDEETDDNWIMLLYLKDNNPNSNIIVEDKTDSEKQTSVEYKPNEIFRFSDTLVDSLTLMIDKEFKKKLN
tara:strand:- start:23617 stop:24783 length:1167 start_codon:yes stop_codon:yes gene_type:complete